MLEKSLREPTVREIAINWLHAHPFPGTQDFAAYLRWAKSVPTWLVKEISSLCPSAYCLNNIPRLEAENARRMEARVSSYSSRLVISKDKDDDYGFSL